MPVDNEVDALVNVVANAILKAATTPDSVKNVGQDYADAMQAGGQAATALVSLFLSDVRRMADALEILAKSELDRGKSLL
jgi:hypothetical protein